MASATKDSMKAKPAKEKDAPQGEPAPWEVAEEGTQDLEVFVVPDASQYRRKLGEAELIAWVAAQAGGDARSDEEIARSIFAQIAEADTLDEVLDGKVETVKGKEILDTVLECNSIKFALSTEEKGFPYFAILDVRHGPARQQEVISVGGVMVCAQLAQMHYRACTLPIESPYRVAPDTVGAIAPESFPFYFKIKRKKTASGEMNYLTSALK